MQNTRLLLALLACTYLLSCRQGGKDAEDHRAVQIIIDGSKKLQQIDGIGVNVNTRSWNGRELEPALDLLLDSMRANIWRVIVETVEKWEEKNDNNDPFNFNWSYYNNLYETPKFEKAWSTIAYLNKKGITDNLMINFMGSVPAWMGRNTIKPEYEDEYIEMIVSFFHYARNKRHLQFGLVSPFNESDIRKEGPELDEKQYARLVRKLIDRMDAMGMNDIRYICPDVARMDNGVKRYIPELMKDSVIMSRIPHIGLHSYDGYYENGNPDSALRNSAYPASDYWMTEWNAWRDGLDDGQVGVYDYAFAEQCMNYLFEFLKNGATAALVWEGYDSYYEHHAPSLFSYWGILSYDPDQKTYAPRKHFYALQQVSKFVAPGSWRLQVSETKDSIAILAFKDMVTGRMAVTGINTSTRPIDVQGELVNLSPVDHFDMYYTNSSDNMKHGDDVQLSANSFRITIPANTIFTLSQGPVTKTSQVTQKPEPPDWYAGDIHVHRNCGDGTGILPYERIKALMEQNNLSVVSLLADMGNGEVKESGMDLLKINDRDAPQSDLNRIIHWDAEWHWDATYSNFSNQALGGHLVLLGLKEAKQIWEESPYKILDWAGRQNAIKGFAHMQYLNDRIQDTLNCCIPIDYPVEAALGTIDFISEDVYGSGSPNNGNYNSEAAIAAYYRLLNCGFRISLAAGTDYPCNEYEPVGKLLTYVKVKDKLTYDQWVLGIKKGNTVVSRNGHTEFLDMKINDGSGPGDEIKLNESGKITVEVRWSSAEQATGRIELVSNGKVVASRQGTVAPETPLILSTTQVIDKSSWFCARRMNESEHVSHSSAAYVIVGGKPVRANAADAEFFVEWIDNILRNITASGKWNRYFTQGRQTTEQRYRKARDIYNTIAAEAK